MTANWLSIWGFGQYAVVKGRGADAAEVTWHATVAYIVLGAISLGLVALFGGRLDAVLRRAARRRLRPRHGARAVHPPARRDARARADAPDEVPRVGHRDRRSASCPTPSSALSLAALGLRRLVDRDRQHRAVDRRWWSILVRAAGFASWATPTQAAVGAVQGHAARSASRSASRASRTAPRATGTTSRSRTSSVPARLGAYNMAYNLADIPAIQVGEQIALVLMPSMAELPPRAPAARARARERAAVADHLPARRRARARRVSADRADPAGQRVAARRAAARRSSRASRCSGRSRGCCPRTSRPSRRPTGSCSSSSRRSRS